MTRNHNKAKRQADRVAGLSPEAKRSNSPASVTRSQSKELNGRAASATLSQQVMTSYLASPVPESAQTVTESTQLPPPGSQAQTAFPSLPEGEGRPPLPTEIVFPDVSSHGNKAILGAYTQMCIFGRKFQGDIANGQPTGAAELREAFIQTVVCFGHMMEEYTKGAVSYADVAKG